MRDNGRRCRECGVQLWFRRGPAGKWIPLQRVRAAYGDAEASDTVELVASGVVYISHFETCPRASAFSRGGRDRRRG